MTAALDSRQLARIGDALLIPTVADAARRAEVTVRLPDGGSLRGILVYWPGPAALDTRQAKVLIGGRHYQCPTRLVRLVPSWGQLERAAWRIAAQDAEALS